MSFFTADEPNGPVGSGIDCFIQQDNKALGFSTGMNVNENFNIEGIQTLGYYGYRDFLSTGYDCDFDLDTFLLRGDNIAGSLSVPGWTSSRKVNINNSGLYVFSGIDVHTLDVLFTLIGCQYASGSLTVQQGQLMKKATKWKSRAALPGLHTS